MHQVMIDTVPFLSVLLVHLHSVIRLFLHLLRTRSTTQLLRLYRKHAWYRRQSHWNVLNGTNVFAYVLVDRSGRMGIHVTAIIREQHREREREGETFMFLVPNARYFRLVVVPTSLFMIKRVIMTSTSIFAVTQAEIIR